MTNIRIGNRLSIYVSKVAKGCNGETPPWRGSCWGSDWPRISLQDCYAAYCLDISWLCYFASIYWNKRTRARKVEEPGNG